MDDEDEEERGVAETWVILCGECLLGNWEEVLARGNQRKAALPRLPRLDEDVFVVVVVVGVVFEAEGKGEEEKEEEEEEEDEDEARLRDDLQRN